MNAKQTRFVAEYLIDLNATQAAIRAGYSKKTAASIGQRLLRNVEISAAVEVGQTQHSEDLGITREWVLTTLKRNIQRAMQSEEITDHNGATGVYRYEGAVANRALELLGKHLGMFADTVKVEDLTSKTDEELEAIVRRGSLKIA